MSLPYKPTRSLRATGTLGPVAAALEDSGFLSELLGSSPGGVVLVEASDSLPIVYCNESFERWAPLGRHPLVGSSLPELFDWTERETVRDTYREAIMTGRPQHRRAVPYRLRGAATLGEPCYWSVSHYPLRGARARGRVTHVLSLMVDVTEQAGQRARAAESHQRVLSALAAVARHLLDSDDRAAFFGQLTGSIAELVSASRATFWLYDAEARAVSPQAPSFGFTEAELGRLAGEPCAPRRLGAIGRAVLEDRVLRVDVDMDDRDTAALRSQLRELGVRDAVVIPWRTANQRLGALAVYGATRPWGFMDEDVWVLQSAAAAAALVREHQLADEALAAVRAREAAGLQHQVEQSIKLEQIKADYLKLASHELRAPLGVVRGYVAMMQDGTFGPLDEELTTVLPVLMAKVEDMSRLINEMLETARLDDGALELRRSRLDLRSVVADGVRTLEPLAGPRHRLISSVPGQPVPVDGDVARLTMIVANLVHNAIKYSPDGGDVRVVCGANGDSATIEVTDQGIGIADADRGRLFTRFGRLQSERTRDIPGTGLGLYLARDLARRHGGDIAVASEPGRGSTFTLSLPLAASP